MEDPFYPGFLSIRPARPRAAPPAMAESSRPAKVVSIPVHFVSSDETKQRQSIARTAAASRATQRLTPSAAALAIQRAFRGFLVRKNLRAVRRIEAEVDAVEKEVARALDRRGCDARERLWVSETLMALLFRLDSVRGVRDYRRRVIRRAIALQEAVDEIAAGEESKEEVAVAGNDVGEIPEGNSPGETLEAQATTPTEISRSMDLDLEAQENHGGAPSGRDEDGEKKADEKDSAGEVVAEESKQEEGQGTAAATMEKTLELPTKRAPSMEAVSEEGSGAMAMGEASEDIAGDQLGEETQSSVSRDEGNAQAKTGESPAPDEMHSFPPASAQALDMAEGRAGQGCGDDMRRATERMLNESKGLQELVAELCERNEMQLRLMDELLQRMERLEKAVGKMERKKQKRQDAKKCCARKRERRL